MTKEEQELFIDLVAKLQKEIHETACEKGWWPYETEEFAPAPNFGEKIALMHAELSEALEAIRQGNGPSDHIPEFSGAEEEFVDVFIRMLDTSGWKKWNFGEALFAKMAFNKTRAHKHGGKIF